MIVSCSHCEKRISIEEARIPPQGLRIRCAHCGEPLLVPSKAGSAEEERGAGPAAPPPAAELFLATTVKERSLHFLEESAAGAEGDLAALGAEGAWAAPGGELSEPSLSLDATAPTPAASVIFGEAGSWGEEPALPSEEQTLVEARSDPARELRLRQLHGAALRVADWLAGPLVLGLVALSAWGAWLFFFAAEGEVRLLPLELEVQTLDDGEGGQLAWVQGALLLEEALANGQGIRLEVELWDEAGTLRATAHTWAGALPPAEELALLAAEPAAWEAWLDRSSPHRHGLEAGKHPFFALFHQLPGKTTALQARLRSQIVPIAGPERSAE